MGILENNDISEDDFVVLLEDRSFVDYFNIYLSLPIFGQHVVYSFIEREFSYEPPIRKKKSLVDRREVVHWLYTKRYPSFSKSNLCTEYILSSRLRDLNVNLLGKNVDESDDQATLTRNILGNAVGMQLFRESLIGTPGEKCYKCWLDLERHRRMPPGEQRQRLMLYIRNIYLADGALHELQTAGRHAVFEGKLNFELIPETEIQRQLIKDFGSGNIIYRKNSDDAFQQLERLIVAALRMYWVPRYLLNLLKTIPKQYLAVLKRATPYDQRALQEHRQMTCRLVFPKIYDADSSPTKLIESNIDGEMKNIRIKPLSARSDKPRTQYTGSSLSDKVTLTSSLESCSIPDGEHEEDIKISDFLSIAGGGRLEYVEPKESKSSISSQEFESFDFGNAEPRTCSSETAVTTTSSFTQIRPTLSIPPSLATYISGKNRIKTGRKTNNKVMFALAADNLAGNPLQSYLNRSGKTRDEKLLKLWIDVRQYLDADDSHRDEFGHSIKQHLARVIFNQYLVSNNDDLLPESVKMSIYTSLSRQDDATLLCFVQDFVTGSLKDTWKIFMLAERKAFRKQVVGSRHFDRNVLEYPPNMDKDLDDPLLLINTSQGISPEMLSKDYRPKSGSMSEERPWSRLSDNLPVALTDEQIMKAFEFTVILAEYGRPGMFTYKKPTIADIIDVLYSDFGSLHINKVHPKRHPFLYNLMNKPKIDIENLKVSREVFLDRPTIIEADDTPRNNRLVLRRDGLLIERPPRPRNFMEVLNSALHYDFFRRFMASNKTPYPLAFWRNIEELRQMPPGRLRHNMISNIIRKYFGKSAKQGAWLDCSDDIIRQIPSMEKVPLSVLICAQASVFRAMEQKWYPKYLETFPPDADYEPEFQVPTLKEEPKPRVRRVKKKRTLYLWNSFLTMICAFLKSMKDQREVQLLELYMRKEIRREFKKQNSKQHDYPPNKNVTTGSNIHFQPRIVLKNRLVYVDKLPMDLRFWCEIARYVEMVDYIHGLKPVSRNNEDFLYEKARTIVNYYVSSDIPPKNQLNISTDLATNISNSLDKDGPTRGLFHDALLVIFPLIYHYWRQCQKEWMKNHTAAELMEMIEEEEKSRERPSTPHKLEEVPDYLRIRASQIKVATQFVSGYIIDEDQWIINFSLVDGMRILLPQPKNVPKHGRKGSLATRRTSVMEKGSHKTVTGSDSKMSESSHKKEKSKDKEKSKLKTKSKKKMDALTEEADSRFSSQNIKPTKSRSSHTPPEGKEKLVDELVERSSKSPSRLRKMNDLVSAAIQDDIDQDIFGTE
ncbi:regulator of G-protein signaling protein-like [Mytilus californianus]|uniref:regulator of G-protein signaling protein-like n=1 Tax=Mytilus californianus TaxID=6549 RepID=UPI002247C7E5|nr:regulator of G-protein signaling protein-like [Mytilus californianus]